MQEKGRYHSSRILCVVTGCGGGDWHPLLALAAGLQLRGHDLTVACDRSTVQYVQASGLTTLCLPQGLDLADVFQPALSRLLSRQEKLFPGDENPLEKWGVSCVDYVKSSLNGWRPSLIITSLLAVGLGAILAGSLATPWCFLNPSFYFGPPRGYLRDEDFSEMGVEMYRHWLLPLVETADMVLHATDQAFDICPALLPSRHRYVGPMFWELPGNAQEFLQVSGPPWILIALSTSPQPGDLTIVKIALKALEMMDFRILVTLADGHDKEDLGRIAANVHVTGYTPHSNVLPYCRLVISHAGHGIVMKSMAHGIPMVLVPWGRDQPGVAARARRLGTAVVVSRRDYCEKTLIDAVNVVLNSADYLAQSQLQSNRLRRMDPVAKAAGCVARFIENCAKDGKLHVK